MWPPPKDSSTRVIIAGGGIGGLTTALFCDRAGLSVQVYERAREIRAVGVGLNLLPHAVRELDKLGLLEILLETGVETEQLVYHNCHGQRIWAEPRGRLAGYHWPQISIHRGQLQEILLNAVRQRLGDNCVQTDRRLIDYTDDDSEIVTTFASSSGAVQQSRAEILIAADGIHSTARRGLYPDEGDPIYSGVMLWRGTTITKPFMGGRSMVMAGHREQKFVCYPLAKPDASGRQLINWVADLRRDQTLGREDWNRRGDPDDILPAFADWHFDWLNVPSLISEAEGIYEFPMVDRDPLPCWSQGRMTMLGDAAHPMYPIGSNGATQAIRDASALIDALQSEPGVSEAISRYEAVRRPATAQIVLSNRSMGPEIIMQIAHERAPGGYTKLEDVIAQRELEDIASHYKRVAGFDPAILNANKSVLDESITPVQSL